MIRYKGIPNPQSEDYYTKVKIPFNEGGAAALNIFKQEYKLLRFYKV